MDIHEYLGVLRRGVVLILIGIIVGLAGGFVAQSMERPSYSATSRELLTNKVAGDLSISQGRIASYVLVASSGLVLQPVIDELGLDTTVDQLARQVTVVAPPQTVVIEITATADTAEEARDIANTISGQFGEVVADQLETTTGVTPTIAPTPTPGATAAPAPVPSPSTTRLPDGTIVPIAVPTAPVRVVNLEQAALPSAPNPSNGPLMLLVGGVAGLALGLLAASVREAADRRVRTPRDVARVTDVPVVGAIVSDRRIRSTGLTARAGSRSPSAESFRAVRAHIDHLRDRDGRRLFVLTAAGHGQGTTTVAANLAVAIANTGSSVVVVDADLRHPALSALFGLQSAAGLSSLLAGRSELDAVVRGSGTPNLSVVPAGTPAVNAGELIATPRMRSMLVELARRYEVVIIDTPSIATASEAAVLGAMTGTTLLVVAQGATTRPRLDDALALLEAGGSEPIGIVLTRTRRTLAGRAPQAAPGPMRGTAPARSAAVAEGAPAPAAAPAAAPKPKPEAVAQPVGTAVAVRTPEPSHLAAPLVPAEAPATPRAPRAGSRRVTQPATVTPAAKPVVAEEPAKPVAKTAKPAVKPAVASTDDVTEISHTLGKARELDSAFAALPTATADEQRAGSIVVPDIDDTKSPLVERPIVIRPDAPRSSSRFAPDPTRFAQRLAGAYGKAPAPTAGTEGQLPEPQVTGTIINTVSIRVQRDIVESATVPPPIRHILPRPTASTIPPKEVEAARPVDLEPEPQLVERRPKTGPVPVPPLAREPLPAQEVDDDPTAETPPPRDVEAETRAIPVIGSLLGEIGGLPRVEVRAARIAAVTDTAPNPERQARESYELRARDLERAAHERLMREQQRLAVNIREQLAHDKRELESVLDNRLEDTVLRPEPTS